MTTLPIWFLVLSLILPRIALIAAFFTDGSFPHLFTKWLSVPMALLIPRVLILIAIAQVMGICIWFWIHLVVMLLVWAFNALRITIKRSKGN
jgi:hypothetical protein